MASVTDSQAGAGCARQLAKSQGSLFWKLGHQVVTSIALLIVTSNIQNFVSDENPRRIIASQTFLWQISPIWPYVDNSSAEHSFTRFELLHKWFTHPKAKHFMLQPCKADDFAHHPNFLRARQIFFCQSDISHFIPPCCLKQQPGLAMAPNHSLGSQWRHSHPPPPPLRLVSVLVPPGSSILSLQPPARENR